MRHYSENKKCIGKISPYKDDFFIAIRKSLLEAHRVLKNNGILAVYICDFYKHGSGFVPVGINTFDLCMEFFSPVDVIAVVRHNKDLDKGNFRKAAVEQNFFLRGFNYLFIFKKLKNRQ